MTLETNSAFDLESLISQHGNSILRLCFLYLKDYQLAEDATQDTFIKVYTKFSSFNNDSSVKTWISRIAINVCKDMMRRRSFSQKSDELSPLLAAGGPSLDELAAQKEENHRLIEAVWQLEPIHKEVILLFYYQQLKISEIATAIGKNENTVKSRLKRAKARLAILLGEEF